MHMPTRRLATILLVGFLFLGAAPSASASTPANDDFANADPVTTLPFADSGDLTGMTAEPGEPLYACLHGAPTAWYVFTPSATGTVRVNMSGSAFPLSSVAYESSGGGFAGLTHLGCASQHSELTLAVTAGSTYYFQVGTWMTGQNAFQLRIDEVLPPANDDFAGAEVLPAPPTTATVDLTAASVEPGEPGPGGAPIVASAWYSYTPTANGTFLVESDANPATVVGVYTGSSLSGLTETTSGHAYMPPLFVAGQAGTTYYVQIARSYFGFGGSPVVPIKIDEAGPPSAGFHANPFEPSIHETVQFSDASFDPAFIGFGPAQWDFGDGTTATGCCVSHRYEADGDYTVTMIATTLDGRTATATRGIGVRTHDVSIDRIQAPNSARVGQTKNVRVNVKGGKYSESVQVDLLKSVAGGSEQLVGSQTLPVPAAKGGQTTGFEFTYSFSPDDGAAGKVTFRAVATIFGARDALPADNQAIAAPTKVSR